MKETRLITQTKIWILSLNPMTDRTESRQIAAIAFSREKLVEFYQGEKADEFWKDGRFRKGFKKGSALEWFNELKDIDSGELDHWGHGIYWEWVIEEDIDPGIPLIEELEQGEYSLSEN